MHASRRIFWFLHTHQHRDRFRFGYVFCIGYYSFAIIIQLLSLSLAYLFCLPISVLLFSFFKMENQYCPNKFKLRFRPLRKWEQVYIRNGHDQKESSNAPLSNVYTTYHRYVSTLVYLICSFLSCFIIRRWFGRRFSFCLYIIGQLTVFSC